MVEEKIEVYLEKITGKDQKEFIKALQEMKDSTEPTNLVDLESDLLKKFTNIKDVENFPVIEKNKIIVKIVELLRPFGGMGFTKGSQTSQA